MKFLATLWMRMLRATPCDAYYGQLHPRPPDREFQPHGARARPPIHDNPGLAAVWRLSIRGDTRNPNPGSDSSQYRTRLSVGFQREDRSVVEFEPPLGGRRG